MNFTLLPCPASITKKIWPLYVQVTCNTLHVGKVQHFAKRNYLRYFHYASQSHDFAALIFYN